MPPMNIWNLFIATFLRVYDNHYFNYNFTFLKNFIYLFQYLNSGPGCIGGAYVNSRHRNRNESHLMGWWGNKKETRFLMKDICDRAPGVEGFRLCNPPPFLVALVMASLEV